jgi:hypothetical protein
MNALPGQPVDIPLPPYLPLTLGYRGDARFVGFFWSPRVTSSLPPTASTPAPLSRGPTSGIAATALSHRYSRRSISAHPRKTGRTCF